MVALRSVSLGRMATQSPTIGMPSALPVWCRSRPAASPINSPCAVYS